MSAIWEKLAKAQAELKVPKSQFNKFGGFAYRSKEDILEAAKPVCRERGLALVCDDEVVSVAEGWVYVRATAAVIDVETGERAEAHGWAREAETKKGMDASQITGTASSYAGKRALGNLLALDDTADADAQAPQAAEKEPPKSGPFNARCRSCGTAYRFESVEQYLSFIASVRCCERPDWAVE